MLKRWLRLLASRSLLCATILAACLLSASYTLAEDGVVLPNQQFLDVLWTDGVSVTVVGGTRLRVLDRLGEPAGDGIFVRSPVEAAGTGQGPESVVVVIGSEGEVARYESGLWVTDVIPVDLDSELVAVEVDAEGRAYILETAGGLHIWHGDSWQRVPPPEGGVDARAIALGDSLWMMAEGGALFELDGGRFMEVELDDWSTSAHRMVQDLWYDAGQNTLWAIGGGDWLYRLDLTTRSANSLPMPLFSPSHVAGAVTSSGSLVLIAGSSKIIIYDGTDYFEVTDAFSFPSQVQFVPGQARVYVVGSRRATSFPVGHRFLGTSQDQPIPPPHLESREHYGGLRLAIGQNWHRFEGADSETSLAFDASLFASFDLTVGDWRWAVRPQLGYRFDNHDQLGAHLATVGFGPTLRSDALSLGYSGHVLFGSSEDEFAWGVSHGPRFDLFLDIIGVDFQHQGLMDATSDDVLRVTVTLDVGRLTAAVFGVGTIFAWMLP